LILKGLVKPKNRISEILALWQAKRGAVKVFVLPGKLNVLKPLKIDLIASNLTLPTKMSQTWIPFAVGIFTLA
jgi:hypothetical protein